jgi:hypothetical protein
MPTPEKAPAALPPSRTAAALLLVATLGAACMLTPANGDALCSKDTPLTFGGFVPTADATVVVEASTSAAGPFVTVAQTLSNHVASTTDLFEWRTGAVIATWASTRGGYETFVRARVLGSGSSSFTLITFDNATVGGGDSGLACLIRNWAREGTSAAFTCRSASSPIVHLTAPLASTCSCALSHTGNVNISRVEDVEQWKCLQTLDGNLTAYAPSSYLPGFTLPALNSITGSVTIDYSPPGFRGLGPPQVRDINFPALTTIGGGVNASFTNSGIVGPVIDVDMPLMTSLGGDITATIQHSSPNLKGLSGLITMPGNVSLHGVSDLFAFQFLNHLEHVSGNVLIDSGNSTGGMFGALVSIDGNLVLQHPLLYATFGFGNLQTIGGSFQLLATEWPPMGPHLFGQLASVGGALTVSEVGPHDFSRLGAASLNVGGLTVTNADLCSMNAAALHVATGGAITITGNAHLTNADANAFVTAQQLAGWTGPMPMVSGNGAGGACP